MRLHNLILWTLLSCSFIFSSFSLKGQDVLPEAKKTLLEHLKLINEDWSLPGNYSDELDLEIAFRTDNKRIQKHFEMVVQLLQKREVSYLSKDQRERRLRYLDLLKAYGVKGEFPSNSFHSVRAPYFIDNKGVSCAVAHLVQESGANPLAQKIRGENNCAYIKDLLVSHPELEGWAIENGFTLDELKLIQPCYWIDPPEQEIHHVGNGGGCNGQINIMQTSPSGGRLYMAGNFTEMDGVQANSIIAWNGTDWITMGDGVDGEIHALHWHNDRLHIAGHFMLHGASEYSSIAYWKNENWIPMQSGGTGSIYAMETYQGKLHIGGAFQNLDGIEMANLAFYDEENMEWKNNGLILENNELVEIQNVFSVNDTVRCFMVFEDLLYVGGDFTLTAPEANLDLFQKTVNCYAKWYGYIWQEGEPNIFYKITDIQDSDNPWVDTLLFVGHAFENYTSVIDITDINSNSNYYLSYSQSFEDHPAKIYGHFKHNDKDYFYGNIYMKSMTVYAEAITQFRGIQGGIIDNYITAGASFKDHMYLAGPFTEMFGIQVNGLCYSAWEEESVPTRNPQVSFETNIYSNQKNLYVNIDGLDRNSILSIYNTQGQLLRTLPLQEGNTETVMNLSNMSEGTYIYQVMNKQRSESGKFFIN